MTESGTGGPARSVKRGAWRWKASQRRELKAEGWDRSVTGNSALALGFQVTKRHQIRFPSLAHAVRSLKCLWACCGGGFCSQSFHRRNAKPLRVQSDLTTQSGCTQSGMHAFSASKFWNSDFWESSGSRCSCTAAHNAQHWLIKGEKKKATHVAVRHPLPAAAARTQGLAPGVDKEGHGLLLSRKHSAPVAPSQPRARLLRQSGHCVSADYFLLSQISQCAAADFSSFLCFPSYLQCRRCRYKARHVLRLLKPAAKERPSWHLQVPVKSPPHNWKMSKVFLLFCFSAANYPHIESSSSLQQQHSELHVLSWQHRAACSAHMYIKEVLWRSVV